MVVQKLSISVSKELADALRDVAAQRDEDLSPLIEVLLRENWVVAVAVQRRREQALGATGVRDAEVERWLLRGRLGEPFDSRRDPKA